MQSSSKPRIPHVIIGIVGADNVGKTTFITSTLDLKAPPSSLSTTKKMSLDGSVYMVCLVEIPSKEIFVDGNRGIIWPRFGSEALDVDGLLVLHDTSQPDTFGETIHLLSASTLREPCGGAKFNEVNRA